jgi:hypothetical protein
MTSERDIERLLDRWFVDQPTEVSERVLDDVAGRISRQRQRPGWRLHNWRSTTMFTPFRLAAVASALVAILIGGSLFIAGGGSPAPAATATPPSSPAPPGETPAPSTLVYDWPGTLEAGTYTTRTIWDVPFEWRFTVPDGWQSRDVEVLRGPTNVGFNLAGNTYSDPCAKVAADPPTGPTVDDLANAIAALPAFDATDPRPATLGGVSGKYLELAVRDDASCEAPGLWADPPGAYNGAGPIGPPSWGAEQSNVKLWILDVDGTRFVISALWSDAATAEDISELQAVVDSFRFVPFSGASASPSS